MLLAVHSHSRLPPNKMTPLALCSSAVLIVALLVDISHASPVDVDCNNWKDDIDKASSVLFLAGDRDMVVPKTADDVDDFYCKRHTSSIETVRKISRVCLKPFPKQVIGLLLFGSREELRECCQSNVKKQQFFESLKCFEGKSTQKRLHDSFDQFILKIEGIRDSVPEDHLKIPHACCAYNSYMVHLRSLFQDKCSKTSLDYLLNMTDRKVKQAFELVCAGYTSSDPWKEKCSDLNEQSPVRTNSSGKPTAKSVILPLVEIYTQAGSLPEERVDKLLAGKLAE